MALNAAAHHSAEKVAGEKNSGLRAQTDVQCRAAGSPEGSRAAGGSHGRLRGCPGAVAGRAAVGRRGRRGGRRSHPPLPSSGGRLPRRRRRRTWRRRRGRNRLRRRGGGLRLSRTTQPLFQRGRGRRGRNGVFLAHSRLRQWHDSGFPGDVPLRAVFRLVVFRPAMPGILAGMSHKDSSALIVVSGNDMCKGSTCWFVASLCVFPLVVRQGRRQVGMDQKYIFALLVTMLLALCSRLLLSSPRCWASSPVCLEV